MNKKSIRLEIDKINLDISAHESYLFDAVADRDYLECVRIANYLKDRQLYLNSLYVVERNFVDGNQLQRSVKMRIVSKFRDFYDSAKVYDHDHDDVWVRKTEYHFTDNPYIGLYDGCFIVSVAGVLYYGQRYYKSNRGFTLDYMYAIDMNTPIYHYTKNMKDMAKFWKSMAFHTSQYDWNMKYGNSIKYKSSLPYPITSNEINDLHIKFNSPVMLCQTNEWFRILDNVYQIDGSGKGKTAIVINPVLKQVDFHKYLDPFATWQMIDQFRSGVLTKVDDNFNSSISDEDMAKAKGFTHKYSFKKEPTKRKMK